MHIAVFFWEAIKPEMERNQFILGRALIFKLLAFHFNLLFTRSFAHAVIPLLYKLFTSE